MSAYYSENDKFAAAWLRELIKAGLIAPGEVDERSIEEVKPDDLRGFTQCHFFAGIGVWSYALRNAGWSDDSPVWTGSCPCQGFSQSGKGEGFSDKRHLWPSWFRLISECCPVVCFGEQVASPAGLAWFDVVSSDLEGEGYAIGAADLCAAGVGAPHIRQRLFFVADSERSQLRTAGSVGIGEAAAGMQGADGERERLWSDIGECRSDGRMADSPERRCEQLDERQRGVSEFNENGAYGKLGHAASNGGATGLSESGQRQERNAEVVNDSSNRIVGGMAHTGREQDGQREGYRGSAQPSGNESDNGILGGSGSELCATNGFWRDAEWLYCRDGKYRPTKPGSPVLATGITNRVGKLRGFGDAINAEVAKGFIEAYMSIQRA